MSATDSQPHLASPAAARSPWPAPRSGSPWAAASRAPGAERVTSRVRKIAEGLPDWEPLPPGETLVRRPGSRT
ncbi:hypothetical protein [Streptomyces sp. CA2R106]|uniref:hypothetical protein n=1 Tax=Streptomyces sp. CA2R106 TaxID=3120153 RepID=UPI00300A3F87